MNDVVRSCFKCSHNGVCKHLAKVEEAVNSTILSETGKKQIYSTLGWYCQLSSLASHTTIIPCDGTKSEEKSCETCKYRSIWGMKVSPCCHCNMNVFDKWEERK